MIDMTLIQETKVALKEYETATNLYRTALEMQILADEILVEAENAVKVTEEWKTAKPAELRETLVTTETSQELRGATAAKIMVLRRKMQYEIALTKLKTLKSLVDAIGEASIYLSTEVTDEEELDQEEDAS